MKKSVFTAALLGVILLSGCSGITQESNISTDGGNSKIEEISSTIAESSNTNNSSENISFPNTSNDSDYDIVQGGGINWLYDRENSFYTNGKNIFEGQTDDKIVEHCYAEALDLHLLKEYSDKYWLYLYWLDADKQEVLAFCAITRLAGDVKFNFSWYNDWERIGNSDSAKRWKERFDNFDFSSTDGNFELDGYKVDITGNYEFSTVDNQFSEWNGKPVIKLEATVQNISSNYDYCMLHCTITAPNGEELTDLDSFFDDGLIFKEIGKGKSKKGYFTFPYESDGEYTLVFSDFITQKYTYKVDVKKPSGSSSKPESESSESQTSNGNHINENFSYDNVISTAQDTYLVGGVNGTRWYFLGSGLFVTFIDDDEYKRFDDEKLITLAYAGMLYNTVEHPNTIYPLYAMMFMEKDGTVAATGMASLSPNRIDMDLRLKWSGEWEHLNSHPKQIELFGESE